MIDEEMEQWWSDNWQGKTEVLKEKFAPTAMWPNTNHMRAILGPGGYVPQKLVFNESDLVELNGDEKLS
jgi:hypothetical protein